MQTLFLMSVKKIYCHPISQNVSWQQMTLILRSWLWCNSGIVSDDFGSLHWNRTLGQFSLIQFSPNSWYLKCHWSLFLDNALGYQAIWMSGLSFSIQRVQNLLKPLRNCADASKLEGKGTLTEKCWHERFFKVTFFSRFFLHCQKYTLLWIYVVFISR